MVQGSDSCGDEAEGFRSWGADPSGAVVGDGGGHGSPDVDGVRCLVLEPRPVDPDEISFSGGEEGRRGRARLLFRCGCVDEGLSLLGVTMLAVRVALDGVSFPAPDQEMPDTAGDDLQTAVRVGSTTTAVDFIGSPDAVTAALLRFTQRLADLDETVFEATRARLLAEEARGLLPVFQLSGAGHLFGVGGYGVADFSLIGLATTTPVELRDWVRTWLVADNAVLSTDGLPRDGLRLALPRGRYRPEPPVGVAVTAPTYRRGAAVALCFTAPRTWAAHLAAGVLRQRARALTAIAVSVDVAAAPLNADTLFVSVRVVPLPGSEQECMDAAAGLLSGLADNVPVGLVAAVQGSDWAQFELSPTGVTDELTEELLLGKDIADAGSPRRIRDADPTDARDVLRAAARRCVLTGPTPPTAAGWIQPGLARRPPVERELVFASTAVPGRRLTLGPTGFTIDSLRGPGIGKGWDRVAVALVGAGHRSIELLLADSTTVRFVAADWSARGHDAVSAVTAHLPPSTPVRVVRRIAPTGPEPARNPLDRWGRTRMRLSIITAAGCGLTALLFLTLLVQDGGNNALVTTTAVLAAITVVLARTARRTYRRGGPQPGTFPRRAPTRIALDRMVSAAGPLGLAGLATALIAVPILLTWATVALHGVFSFTLIVTAWEITIAIRVIREIRLRIRLRHDAAGHRVPR